MQRYKNKNWDSVDFCYDNQHSCGLWDCTVLYTVQYSMDRRMRDYTRINSDCCRVFSGLWVGIGWVGYRYCRVWYERGGGVRRGKGE